jgi:hypothetical protein
MKKLGLLALSLFALSCTDDDDDDNIVVVPPSDDDTGGDTGGDQTPTVLEWRANITSNDIYQGQITGSSQVLQNVGDTAFTASIDIRNDVPGTVRPWHVHFGTCGSGGGIVGSDAAYPRLAVGSDGAAGNTVTIRDIALDPAASYHVNVHESDAQFSLLIACGDLILQ